MTSASRPRIMMALDVETLAEARALVRRLAPLVPVFKIGKQLFVKAGPEAVRMVQRAGADVFLDLKFHDIPNTVAAACIEATRLGVRFVDVHASGGDVMMRAARDAMVRTARREDLRRPKLLAVTVLTSMDDADLARVGVGVGAARQVRRLAALARDAGADGVVASPLEARAVRRVLGPRRLIVTPGVRPAGSALGDQKRAATPGGAVTAGADWIVVGRPIRDAADPAAMVGAMAREMSAARPTARSRSASEQPVVAKRR